MDSFLQGRAVTKNVSGFVPPGSVTRNARALVPPRLVVRNVRALVPPESVTRTLGLGLGFDLDSRESCIFLLKLLPYLTKV